MSLIFVKLIKLGVTFKNKLKLKLKLNEEEKKRV